MFCSRRIRASLFAYAYEFMNVSLVPDEEYDALCRQIDPAASTGNRSRTMWVFMPPQTIDGAAGHHETALIRR